ncbi:1-deoxy-D-xylulose-5-phosphate reductoisomerase [Candidatus Pelagibacter sp.]|uniref:1-deoxy-D-xylulose-5-phosphate reductoisomerase n=1 Tax=Candidatus Pelagibacter sp. TaxID=2024849 RepID=UPI003F836B9C|tara:strand:+ start:815 stop:1993 length:1179 start_codon:yes stop_codon:yes gene_type:complete
MKKKIAILGSTGSIGKSLLNIIKKDKNSFEILLLTANKNHSKLLEQAKKFNVKNLIITNSNSFRLLKKKTKNLKINVFNDYKNLNKIFITKCDYIMSSIIGIDGLYPTINIIKFTKKIAIANKESIICGWPLIQKELKKFKTEFIPVDSEHFSIWYGLYKEKPNKLDKIFITASGGPFHKLPSKKFNNIKITDAINHPNWKMGKKISVDSATMINKVYEVIEAKNIFKVRYNQIKILIHPKSYIHAILKFNNGMIKIVAHDTTMDIPIFNTIFNNDDKKFISNNIDLKILNDLNFSYANYKKFPMFKLLKTLPEKHSLFETVIVSANDTLVNLFLNKKISFTEIQKKLFEVIKKKEFLKYKKIIPRKVNDIIDLNNYVRLKLLKKVYKSSNV